MVSVIVRGELGSVQAADREQSGQSATEWLRLGREMDGLTLTYTPDVR